MGKPDQADQAAGRAADAQSALARELVGESRPTRQAVFSDANAFLQGGRDGTGLREVGAIKKAAEG